MKLTMPRNVWPRLTMLKSVWPRITFGGRLAENRSLYIRDRNNNFISDRFGAILISRPYTAPSLSLDFSQANNSGYIAIIPF